MKYLHIGCGARLYSGWTNIDNSPTVLMAIIAKKIIFFIPFLFKKINKDSFFYHLLQSDIQYGSALNLRFEEESVNFIYSSHMLEHLYYEDAVAFLKQAHNILKFQGKIRLAVPDLDHYIKLYDVKNDPECVLSDALLMPKKRPLLWQRIKYLFLGSRGHNWMYNKDTIVNLLVSSGFCNVKIVPAGQTSFSDVLGLDLNERRVDSLYVEAFK